MIAWQIPASGGDFDLRASTKDAAGKSTLTVNEPTARELELLSAFLAQARQRGWVATTAGISDRGETVLEVGAPVAEAGALLVSETTESDRGVLTLVRSRAGLVVAQADDEAGKEQAREQTAAAAVKPDASAAVTVRRGTVCCPQPTRGPLARASACLRRWCTPAQWATWVRHGFLDVVGNLTGTPYRVFHRHHPAAVALGQCIYDLDARQVLFRWDHRVPAPEEALGGALILAFREHWLRNPSGAHMHRERLFANPFGSQAWDGRWDALLFTGLGQAVDEIGSLLRGEPSGVLTSIVLNRMGGADEMEAAAAVARSHMGVNNYWI